MAISHAIQFSATGNAAAPYAPAAAGANPTVVKVAGLEAKNTGSGAGTVIVYDGSNAGPIVAIISVPALANAAPGVGSIDFCIAREVQNGLVFEVDGTLATIAATVWVI